MIPLRKGRIQPETPIKRGTPERADLYRRSTSGEREFPRLSHDSGLAFLRVRGLQRVRLHADLMMLGRLSLALARARAAPLPRSHGAALADHGVGSARPRAWRITA